MTHRFNLKSEYRLARSLAALLALVALFSTCTGQQPTIKPDNTVSITRTNGSATLSRALGNGENDLPDSTLLAPNDQLYTTPDSTVTLQFSDGSTLQLEPDSRLVLYSIRPADHVATFRLLSGSVKCDLRSDAFEVQGYKQVPIHFNMVLTDLAAIPRGVAGTYQLGFDGDNLKAVINSGEFDIRSGGLQATLPLGWQAIAVPDKPLQIMSLITPTLAPPSAVDLPTATPIQIITLTPTNSPTETPTATSTATATATYTPSRAPTRVLPTPVPNTPTPTAGLPTDTPLPTSTNKPEPRPKPTNPPPPPPTHTPKPPPTNPPPTNPPPTNPPPPPTDPPTLGAPSPAVW